MTGALKKTGMLFACIMLSLASLAQENQPVEMADGLYQSGKIYVVVTVIAVIFIGIVVYLIMLDNKISKLEKEMRNK